MDLNIVICDDRQEDREHIKACILAMNDYQYASVTLCTPDKLLDDINDETFSYNIAVMDIEFGKKDINGIDVARMINDRFKLCMVIYISSYLDFAPMVYESSHCYFVLKKNMAVTLELAMKKATKLLESYNKNEMLSITSNGATVVVKQKDILFVERVQRCIRLVLVDEEYKCYKSLRDIAGNLSENFVRCHRGFYVNMEHIKRIDNNEIIIDDTIALPIGDKYKDSFMGTYLAYCSMRI